MEAPNVKSNRIEIFASAMGINKKELTRHGLTPRYDISAQERLDAEEYVAQINPGKKIIIGIQPFSAETYRNWPRIEELAMRLSENFLILLFHNEALDGYESINIIKVEKPLRLAFAIAAQCHFVISPDSAFLHLAGALSIPSIGIFGPTGGKVITRHYLNTKVVTPDKKDFPCSPCYRNENLLCRLAGNHTSICLENLNATQVLINFAELNNGKSV